MTPEREFKKDDWTGVVRTIEAVADYYDRINNLSTLFQAEKWRESAASYSNIEFDELEIGCGPGSFASHLKGKRIVCVDPSEKLLKIAEARLKDKAIYLLGEAEDLPVESNSFDRVYCSFSFRDFHTKQRSIEEMYRVLRSGGMAIILDIAKYQGRIKSTFMKFHLKELVPLIAVLAIPRSERKTWGRNPYRDLWETYDNFDTPDKFAALMSEAGFIDVNIEILSLGGAFILVGKKP